MNIRDSIAIVTGGASGLGAGTVRMIVENGGKAAIFDLNEERAASLISELGEENVCFEKTDVSSEESVKNSISNVLTKYGSFNTVVNCAGIVLAEKVIKRDGIHSLESFQKIINVNLVGTFNVIRLAAEQMINNEPNEFGERGVIINTASVAAFDGQMGQAAYGASKSAVAGMTLPIARDLSRYGIRVMSIAPGIFETPMFDVLPEKARESLGNMVPFPSRLGKPSEYAHLAKSIVENPMLNGEVIRLDGAIRMQPK
ncbi:3-hydroxyacyl-CoA dehydrogenase [Gottfriedia acidiceleris]|uniref:3-hydroxy-2-methylbutyryl-CoA dehydrogenase n=1 Tax=Gottfriedia luciferensis TaxID=178774 RepID=A0ABX3A281_9BACI|nr:MULTISPECIES: 3-hydroxyacyl-CoA dehydrogenase [Bacillaceae]ODG93423.1 3-hydroxy-2-methylbutyryl-CoA dehydrogenase [Gottfriedia luciferensis]PEC48782.1 3-hydroxyacyl-CoA dehydrogenase [Bacillus sp. AFS096315]PET46515.1 3-hydroxyacyl-CoA dehydrogenase [Bacillus sp. AFS001701]PFM82802.1 3-hydroxyacyl-CoA dehydrogenase [Bacillus sp. AFS077874]PGZ93332.1 3-hydroxyacyl-CoA dehydrogenase [Bacillus sp. AFS029533]